MTSPEIGVITEQNDLGLGFNPLADYEATALNEAAKKKSSDAED